MTNSPTYEYDVFLSHNYADAAWTEMLARRIEAEQSKGRALRAFYSERDIRPGQSIPKRMQDALTVSRKVVLILSPEALKSAWVELEILATLYADISKRQEHLIPLMRRDCEPPYLVAPLRYIDFRNDAKFEESFRLLLAVIKDEALPTSLLPHPTTAPIPRPPNIGFIARYDADGNDLVQVVSQLLKEDRTVALLGQGGVGKTTTAAHIARLMQNEGVRVAWVSADGRAGFTLGTLLDDVATQLGSPETRTLAPEAKANSVRNLLAETRTLVVLDNFETIADEEQKAIAEFLDVVPVPALITSRVNVRHARAVTIGAMSESEAREYLSQLMAISPKRDALRRLNADEIAASAERNPMVMRWIVGQLEVAQRMSDVLDELAHGEGDAATRVFGRSFALLNADAQAVLLSLSLFVPSADRIALAATAGFGDDVRRLNDALRRLAALQLLETDAQNERLSVIGLTRRFARAYLERDPSADEFRQRFVAYFRQYAVAHAQPTPEDFDALEAEKDNVLAAMDLAFALKDWESVMRLANVVGRVNAFLDLHGYWDEAIKRNEQARDAARAKDEEHEIAVYSHRAGVIREHRGEYDVARVAIEEALAIYRKLTAESNVAVALHQLGRLAQDQGDLAEARRLYDETLAIEQKLGDQRGIAISLHQLGRLAQDQGDLAEARRLYDESLAIKKKLGDQRGIAISLHQLGLLAQDQGDLAEARRLYEESLTIAQKLGDQSGIASSLHQLGMIAQDQGELAEARWLYDESLTIKQKLGDQSGIAITLHQLGLLAQDQGDLAEARRLYEESLVIAKKLGDQRGIAISLHQLGRLTEIDGNEVEATRLFREALSIFEKLGSPDAELARRSLERVEGKKPPP